MSLNMIYPPGVNPGLGLYNFWLKLLLLRNGSDLSTGKGHRRDGRARATGAWGRGGWWNIQGWGGVDCAICIWGMDMNDRPILAYGRVYSRYGNATPPNPDFFLDADGRFKLMHLYGTDPRSRVSNGTFLEWGYEASRVQWYVSLDLLVTSRILHDFRDPVAYLPQNTLAGRWYYLEQRDGRWEMAPSTDQASVPGDDNDEVASNWALFMHDKAVALRERRYRRYENNWRRGEGLPPLSARPATVTDDGKRIDQGEAIRQIAALMDVSMPAKSVPLHRGPKEALNGNNLVAAHSA